MLRQFSRFNRPIGDLSEVERSAVVGKRDALYRRTLAVADVVSALAAMYLGAVVLGDDALTPAVVAAIPLIVLVSKVAGLYDRDEHLVRKTTLDEAPALFQVATIYALVIWLAEDLFVDGGLGRQQVLGLWGLLFLAMVAGRALARFLVGGFVPEERCLVLGDPASADQVRDKFLASPSVNASVVGRVTLAPGYRRQEDADSLRAVLEQYDVHRVIIAPRGNTSTAILDAIRLVKSLGIKVSVLPRLFEVVGSSVRFDEVDGLTILGLPRYGLTKSSRFLKRGVDVVGATLGLLVLSPLLVSIALAIKLTSKGPVLFRQPRVGRDGKQFWLLKFRTMVDGADRQKAELLDMNEAEGLFKIEGDPRITRVGRILRRLSLDELPQLINVLRGEMSLVGPRPLVPEDDRRVEGWHRRRLHLSPGMTGVWQILGSARIPLREMVKVDYLYGANWSLWLDVKILLRTLGFVLARRGL